MQHGAFVQLILTLAAIAARMDALMPEFQDVLQLSWTANHRILLILDVGPVISTSSYSFLIVSIASRTRLVELKQR